MSLSHSCVCLAAEREFFIDNLLVRIHFIIVMIRCTGLAPWEFESPFPGSLTSTILCRCRYEFEAPTAGRKRTMESADDIGDKDDTLDPDEDTGAIG